MKSVVAVIIALVVGFAGGFIVCKKTAEPKPEPVPVDVTILSQEVKDIAELATCEDTYKITIPYEGEALKLWKIKIPFSEKSMVVEYMAKLKLGLDLTDDNYKVDVKGDTVTVTIPHSEVLSHEIIEESWVLKDKDNGLFNPLTPEDDSAARQYGEKMALEKLDMDALYKQADDTAKAQIEKFLGLACPDATIVVQFK